METLKTLESLEELEEFDRKLLELLASVENAGIYYELSSASQTLFVYIISKDLEETLHVSVCHPDREGVRWLIIDDFHEEGKRTYYEKDVRIKGREVLERFIETLKKEFRVEREKCDIDREWFIENGLLRIKRI